MGNYKSQLLLATSWYSTRITLKNEPDNILYSLTISRAASNNLRRGLYNKLHKVIEDNNIGSLSIICQGYNKQKLYEIIKTLKRKGINISSIRNITPIVHNAFRKLQRIRPD